MLNLPPVVILCGGKATRLGEQTQSLPKSLIVVNNEPFIDLQLQLIRKHGVREVILCTGHLDSPIREHVGNGRNYDMRISYSHESEALGTAGAIRHALPLLPTSFFVTYGDSYLMSPWAEAYAGFKSSQKPAHLVVYPNHNKWDISNVRVSESQLQYFTAPKASDACTHIDYGLSIFKRSMISALPRRGDLKEVLQKLSAANLVGFTVADERFYEIGSRQGIQDFEAYIQKTNPNDK